MVRFPDSPSMHPTTDSQRSIYARDQWGIQYLLLPGDSAGDQWGIEFPMPDVDFAATAQCRSRGRRRGISQVGAWVAILAIVMAGSALVVDPSVSAGAAPASGAPSGGNPAGVSGDGSPTDPLPTILIRVLEPTPGASPPAVLAAPPFRLSPTVVPTIEDAKSYLVARLGAKAERRWGMPQSQCASLIFEEEAQWNPHATNKTSGAYGLPQAKPASKLGNWAEAKAKAAEETGDPETAVLYLAWRDNPVVQAEWGVDYMIDRYGSPCAALTFRNGYWKNGVLIPGVGWY